MNRNVTVTIFELLGTFAAGALFMYLAQWARELMCALKREVPAPAEPAADPPMLVVAPWSEAGASDVLTGDVLWRHRTEAEAAPTFASTPLPAHESVWRFADWKLDDQHRTQAWPIIKGYDADDLDPGPEPRVDPNTRRRFIRSDAELAALAAAQGFVARESKKHFASVDDALAEAAERLSKSSAKKAVVSS